ncbi:MAG: hypothetical protein RL131_112 [Bacteroidota bacterium]|jgi:nitroimidazol reductase NimA-like FMN-containing flavoprotein (pyridoxamine 5'-phosphate oxidase superfamily)
MNGELTEQQINNILCSQTFGRLACCKGKHPYIVPVTYFYDGKFIYGKSSEGKKIDLMRDNPNVCFQVDFSRDMYNWESAVIYGLFEELKGEDAVKAKHILSEKLMPLLSGVSIHAHEHDEGEGHELIDETSKRGIYFRIKIAEKSGRFQRI